MASVSSQGSSQKFYRLPAGCSKKLRIHHTNNNTGSDVAELYVCRVPSNVSIDNDDSLVSLRRDIPQVPSGTFNKQSKKELAALKEATTCAPLRLKIRNSSGSESREKNTVARIGSELANYFVLVEQDDSGFADLYPASKWYSFDLDNSSRSCDSEDVALKNQRLDDKRDAAYKSKIMSMVKQESDNEVSVVPNTDTSVLQELDFKQLRQTKRYRELLLQRRGVTKSNLKHDRNLEGSALMLGDVRKNIVDWDFDHAVALSDDEEDVLVAEDGNNDYEEEEYSIMTIQDQVNDDAISDNGLTAYGQEMSCILMNHQRESESANGSSFANEVNENDDEDLTQCEDEEEQDDEDDELPKLESYSQQAVLSSQKTGHDLNGSKEIHVGKVERCSEDSNVSDNGKSIMEDMNNKSKEEFWETKLTRKLQSMGGRMDVRDFMSFFKVKKKTSDFFLLQQALQKLCSVITETDSTGNKVKFVQLKME